MRCVFESTGLRTVFTIGEPWSGHSLFSTSGKKSTKRDLTGVVQRVL